MARRTVLAGFAALAGVWLLASSFQGRRSPAHRAAATVPGLGVTVTAELFVLSEATEFERHLTLAADGGEVRVRTADIRGPVDRARLYRAGGDEIVFLDRAGGRQSFGTNPLRRLDGPSRPAADWTCIGAFALALVPNGGDPAKGLAQVFAFVPAGADGDVLASEADVAAGAEQPPHAPAACPGADPADRVQRARAMQNSTMPPSADRSGPGGNVASADSAASP